jgi:CDP-diacylglycerol--glycerol-3-phosphate 3-phosphatidyltransferase
VGEAFIHWIDSPALAWGVPVSAFTVFVGAFVLFGVRSAIWGVPSHPRVKNMGSAVLGQYFLEYAYWLFEPAVKVALALRLTPDVLSYLSLGLHFAAALALGNGAFALGGWFLVTGAICDALDGSVARALKISSDAGEVLDAVIDRWAEMAVFFGYAWYFRDDFLGFIAAAGACMGAIMVSYTRAKGEILGVEAKLGFMQRHERATYLVAATILSALWHVYHPQPHPRHMLVIGTLIAIAVLGNWTGVLRTAFIRRELRRR